MAFADHYPLDAFTAISHVSWWRSSDVEDILQGEWRAAREKGVEYVMPDKLKAAREAAYKADDADKKVYDAGKKIFRQALEAHLEELRANGRLGKTGGVLGRDVEQAAAWNDFVDGNKRKWSYDWMIDNLSSTLTMVFVSMDDEAFKRRREDRLAPHQPPSDDQVVAAWEKLCTLLDAGNSDTIYRTILIDDIRDAKTSDRCQLHFSNWKATLVKQNAEYRYVPAEDVAKLPLLKASFDVPTGDLLITDFLRVEGMDKALDFDDTREFGDELDLSSERGRNARAIAHGKEHDVGYCQTTNTSVAVWRDPATGNLAITHRWFGPEKNEVDGVSPVPGWEKVGTFSCDMWRVTAMDIATAERHTSKEAVETYLSSKDPYADNIVRVKVPSGRWTIHGGENFVRRLPRHRYGLPKRIKLWCILEAPKGL